MNLFASQQFRSFWWLLPFSLNNFSWIWKLHKLLKLFCSFTNIWSLFGIWINSILYTAMPSMGQNKGTMTLTERFAHDEALWKHCKKIYKPKKQTTKNVHLKKKLTKCKHCDSFLVLRFTWSIFAKSEKRENFRTWSVIFWKMSLPSTDNMGGRSAASCGRHPQRSIFYEWKSGLGLQLIKG